MKTKYSFRVKLTLILLCILTFCGALTALLTADVKTTHAATDIGPRYQTSGTYSTGGDFQSGCPSNFTIYMFTRHETEIGSTPSIIYDGHVLNWTYVSIVCKVNNLTSHVSFKLMRGNTTIVNNEMSGSSLTSLYSGSLSSGDYEMTYVGKNNPSIFSNTTYTYKFKFTIDTTPPTGTLKSGTKVLQNKAYTNQQFTYSTTDNKKNYGIHVSKPGSGSYILATQSSYTVTATEANNGWWSFYGEDWYDNTSSSISVYLDTVAPTGKVVAAVGSGGYCRSPFSYQAEDAGGIDYCQVKYPNESSWSPCANNATLTGAQGYGLYTFRCFDKAGNVSSESSIYYDYTKPTGTVYGGTTSKNSGDFTNAGYVKYVATDTWSGVSKCYVRMPGTSEYTEYSSGAQLSEEGTYFFYCVDKAGNTSETVSIVLDKTKPAGTLYAGTSVIQSGGYTNAAYVKFIPSDANGISATYVKKPGASAYVSYTSGTQLTEEGAFSFYSVDKAGNQSVFYTVNVDRQSPSAQLYADGKTISKGSYTNASFIKFICSDTCYVKTPDAGDFSQYISGTEYYKPGKYTFYGIDAAKNSTGNFVLTIDRTMKPVTITNVAEGMTGGDVTMTWTNGNAELYAPIASVTVNGMDYTKGAVIHTIDTGVYKVVSVDAAGNRWETQFTASKQDVLTKTLQKQYFETFDANGDPFAFTSLERALAFATARENALVQTGQWNNSSWDVGIAMDSKDSANAKNGPYYIYKSYGKGDVMVAYFTEERLNEVIAKYATDSIDSYYYWEKDHATAAEGENLYAYSDTRKILAKEVWLADNLHCSVDGTDFAGSVYDTEGRHTLQIKDEWGNTCEYEIIVVRNTPSVYYKIGEGGNIELSSDRAYFFKDSITLSIADEMDEFAMFIVFDESENLLGNFSLGDAYQLVESGKYTVIAVNHSGKSDTFELTISLSAPEIDLKENSETKRLEVTISESPDDVSHLSLLEIYKSIDDENGWELLTEDDYGTPIALGTYTYYFRTSGKYRVVIMDEFRTGIDAIEKVVDYKQPEPIGVLNGVENGGYTNGTVSFEWTDEAVVTLTRNGEPIEYVSGEALSAEGSYVLTFENHDGYRVVYTFTIDTSAPKIVLDGVENEGAVNGDVTVNFVEENLTIELFKDGTSLGEIQSGKKLTESGEYRVTAADRAGNRSEVNFTIDKYVDYEININEKGLANSVTATASEIVDTVLTKDGESVKYKIGDAINEPGSYTLVLTDELGNKATITFTIVKPRVNKFEYNFDDMPDFERVEIGGEEKRLNYGTLELTQEGTYEIGVVAKGKTYVFTVTVDTTAPTLKLGGVENNGLTNGTVTLSELSEEGTISVYFNGQPITAEQESEFDSEGTYRIVVTDVCGNAREYRFTIDTTAPEIILKGARQGSVVNCDITVIFNEENLVTEFFKNGNMVGEIASETVIKEQGTYRVTATDAAGNKAERSFAIDKSVEYKINVNDHGLANSVTATADEEAVAVLTKDGEQISYTLGDTIEEYGDYVLTLTDEMGNEVTITFTIVKPLVNKFEHNFDNVPGFEKVVINGEETRLNYGTLELFEDGTYEVDVVANGQTYTFTVTVDATAPQLELIGVENGGETKGKVVLDNASEEAEIKLYLDGEEVEYRLGREIEKAGAYRVVITDGCGNATEYTFTIQASLNAGIIALVVVGMLVLIGIILAIVLRKRKAV